MLLLKSIVIFGRTLGGFPVFFSVKSFEQAKRIVMNSIEQIFRIYASKFVKYLARKFVFAKNRKIQETSPSVRRKGVFFLHFWLTYER